MAGRDPSQLPRHGRNGDAPAALSRKKAPRALTSCARPPPSSAARSGAFCHHISPDTDLVPLHGTRLSISATHKWQVSLQGEAHTPGLQETKTLSPGFTLLFLVVFRARAYTLLVVDRYGWRARGAKGTGILREGRDHGPDGVVVVGARRSQT
jgi:hypothetical protein